MAKVLEVGWVEFGTSVKFNELLYIVEKVDRTTGKVLLTPLKRAESWQPTAPCPILLDTSDIVERA